jgi:hypothetical protein
MMVIGALDSWDDVKTLEVRVDRLSAGIAPVCSSSGRGCGQRARADAAYAVDAVASPTAHNFGVA